jgi:hypothetical protein
MVCGHLKGISVIVIVTNAWIGAAVEKHLDHDEAVVATDGVLEGRVLPLCDEVWVGACLEGELKSLVVVPVGFAGEDYGEGALVEAGGAEEDPENGVAVGFGDVVRSLFVVGIGAVVEEKLGKARMAGDAGGAVDRGFGDLSRRVVDGFVPAGVGAGTGFEQGAGSVDEGAIWLEAQVPGEAEVREGIPLVRAAWRGREGGFAREKRSDRCSIAQDGSGVDVGDGDVKVALEDEAGVLEGAGAVPAVAIDGGDFEEGADRVGETFDGANDAEGLDVRGKLRPGVVAMFASENELSVGEDEGLGWDSGRDFRRG